MRTSKFQDEPGRANILGTRIDLLDYEQTMQRMEKTVAEQKKATIGFVNVYTIMQARRNKRIREAIENLTLSVPDGMPLVWLSKWTDTPLRSRVYGPDLFAHFCNRSQRGGQKHFFYGSSEEVLQTMQNNLKSKFPEMQIAGSFSPPFRPLTGGEESEIVEMINTSGADVLWICLGSPKQERWMFDMRDKIDVPVMAAVGAAFAFHAGTVKQASQFWQDLGLEWLFRLIQEPRRLAKRYLIYNPLFILGVIKQALTGPSRRTV